MPPEIRFSPIGVAHTTASDDEIRDRGKELDFTIDVFPEFKDALEGIDGFTHLIIMFHFDRLRPEQTGILKVRPKKFLRRGLTLEQLPWVGVFALDSPSRPNPIGFSVVKLLRHDGLRLSVRGLEAFDGTPVLDIKPYTPERVVADIGVPRWYSDLDVLAEAEELKREHPQSTH